MQIWCQLPYNMRKCTMQLPRENANDKQCEIRTIITLEAIASSNGKNNGHKTLTLRTIKHNAMSSPQW